MYWCWGFCVFCVLSGVNLVLVWCCFGGCGDCVIGCEIVGCGCGLYIVGV